MINEIKSRFADGFAFGALIGVILGGILGFCMVAFILIPEARMGKFEVDRIQDEATRRGYGQIVIKEPESFLYRRTVFEWKDSPK
jgi:hypothetical protein